MKILILMILCCFDLWQMKFLNRGAHTVVFRLILDEPLFGCRENKEREKKQRKKLIFHV